MSAKYLKSDEDGFPSGRELCTVHLKVDFTDSDEPRLWDLVSEQGDRMRGELSDTVYRRLGKRFEVRSLSFARGSVDIVVIIAATGAALASYGGLREGVDYVVDDFKRFIRAFFGNHSSGPVFVSASWSPGPLMMDQTSRPPLFRRALPIDLVLLYVLISHAVLLGLFAWLIITKLGA